MSEAKLMVSLVMLKISVLMDRKAALLAGLVVGEWETIEVSMQSIGDDIWPELVSRIDLRQRIPRVEGIDALAAPTIECLSAELRRRWTER